MKEIESVNKSVKNGFDDFLDHASKGSEKTIWAKTKDVVFGRVPRDNHNENWVFMNT